MMLSLLAGIFPLLVIILMWNGIDRWHIVFIFIAALGVLPLDEQFMGIPKVEDNKIKTKPWTLYSVAQTSDRDFYAMVKFDGEEKIKSYHLVITSEGKKQKLLDAKTKVEKGSRVRVVPNQSDDIGVEIAEEITK